MVTRLYFENGGDVIVTPTATTGWTFQPVSTFPLTKTKRSSAMGTQTRAAGAGTNGQFGMAVRFVSTPLKAQTISGTIKGQMRVKQSAAGNDTTLCVAVKLIKPDGSDRSVLLSPAAADTVASTPPEMADATQTNRKFLDSSESAAISLTSQSASDGDLLVVEVGYRYNASNNPSCEFSIGSDSGTDLSEDDTSTTADNPWIEFSGDLNFQPIYWFGSASTPGDNGAQGEPATIAVTPPTGMLTGDLVFIIGIAGATTANVWSQSALGGQTWTAFLDDTGAGSNTMQHASWWCEFDGTWDTDPSLAVAAISGTVPASVVMHVFRGATAWASDVTATKTAFAAPGAGIVTITAQNPVANDTITLAGWFVRLANTWGTLSGAGWENCGAAQYRNTTGTDHSATFAYIYVADGATPANVSKTESANTAGLDLIGTLKGTIPSSGPVIPRPIPAIINQAVQRAAFW